MYSCVLVVTCYLCKATPAGIFSLLGIVHFVVVAENSNNSYGRGVEHAFSPQRIGPEVSLLLLQLLIEEFDTK